MRASADIDVELRRKGGMLWLAAIAHERARNAANRRRHCHCSISGRDSHESDAARISTGCSMILGGTCVSALWRTYMRPLFHEYLKLSLKLDGRDPSSAKNEVS